MLERYAVYEHRVNDAPVLVERFDNESQAGHMVNNKRTYFAIDLQEGIGVYPPARRIEGQQWTR